MLSRLLDKKQRMLDARETQGSLLNLMASDSSPATSGGSALQQGSLLSDIGRIEHEQARQSSLEEATRLAERAHPTQADRTEFAETEKRYSSPPEVPAPNQAEQLDLLAHQLDAIRHQHADKRVVNSGTGTAYSTPAQGGPANYGSVSPFSFDRIVLATLSCWKLAILGAIAGAALTAVYALSLPNVYQAVAEILIEPRGIKVLENNVSPDGLNREATIAYSESQVRIITSSSVVDPVIDELELAEDREFNGEGTGIGGTFSRAFSAIFGTTRTSREPLGATRTYFYENMFVKRVNQTFTILVGMTTEDPHKSARIANALARSYMNDESGSKSRVAKTASTELAQRLGELRDRLTKSEEAVERYKAENGLVDAGGRLVSDIQLARLNEQLAIAKVQTGDARTRAELAANADLGDVIAGSLPNSVTPTALTQIRVTYSRAKSKLDRIATKLGERHPERIGAESELRSARSAIAEELRRMVRSANEEYKRARAREADLVAQVNSVKATAVGDSAAKVQLRNLQANVEANRQIYTSVLQRTRETNEQENIQTKSARIISEATPPDEKLGPQRKLIVLIGLVLGAMAGIGLGLLPFLIRGFRELIDSFSRSDGARPSSAGLPLQSHDLYSTSSQAASSPMAPQQTAQRNLPLTSPDPEGVPNYSMPPPAAAQPSATPTATVAPTAPPVASAAPPVPASPIGYGVPHYVPQPMMLQPQAQPQMVYVHQPPIYPAPLHPMPVHQAPPPAYYSAWNPKPDGS